MLTENIRTPGPIDYEFHKSRIRQMRAAFLAAMMKAAWRSLQHAFKLVLSLMKASAPAPR
jgi:hypothetical protein